MNEARRLFNVMVMPAFDDWQKNLASERHARAVAEPLNNMAEWVFHHLTNEGYKTPEKFRAYMADNHPEYCTIVNVANGTKHVELTRGKPKATRADQTCVSSYGIFSDVKNVGGLVNFSELKAWFVNLDDGTREDLYDAVVKCISMWEKFLEDKGV